MSNSSDPRLSRQENGEPEVDAFDQGPQFDPERGVVYPPSEEVFETRFASPTRTSNAPLELDPKAVAHAFSKGAYPDDEVFCRDPYAQRQHPLDAEDPVFRKSKRPSRRFPLGVFLFLLLLFGLGLTFFQRVNRTPTHSLQTPARTQAGSKAQTESSASLSESIDKLKEHGQTLQKELQVKAEQSFDVVKQGLEGMSRSPLVIIESSPDGAEIWMEDEWLGNTPFAGDNRYPKGTHRLRLKLKGYQDAMLEIQGGESSRLSVELRRR